MFVQQIRKTHYAIATHVHSYIIEKSSFQYEIPTVNRNVDIKIKQKFCSRSSKQLNIR